MSLSMIIGFLIIGIIISYFNLLPQKWLEKSKFVTNIGLIFLLWVMGIKIGANEEIIKNLNWIGLNALIIALFTISGSIFLLVIFAYKIDIFANIPLTENKVKIKEESDEIKMDYIIIIPVITGIICGVFFISPHYLPFFDKLTNYALGILLLGVGLDLGLNKSLLKQFKNYGIRIFFIPLFIAAGSILGSVLAGIILGIPKNQAAAVGAGFGWYSLSGIIISNMGFPEIGSLAFLSNIFREIITLISLPYIARFFKKVITIAPGGATAMDVTLPIIKKIAGNEIVIPAFISGIILSGLVPILVPLFMNI